MMGVVELLKNTSLNELQHEYIHTVLESGKSLQQVVHNLLDLSKIGTDSLELSSESFDLIQMASEVCQLYKPQADELDIELVEDFPEQDSILLQGDVRRMRQIMLYLLGSALGGGDESQIYFKIKVDDRGDNVALMMELSGQAAVESADEQLSSSTVGSDEVEMDLTIARELVDVMGGELGLLHTGEGVKQGVWFTLNLPKASEIKSATPSAGLIDEHKEEISEQGVVIHRNILNNLQDSMGDAFSELISIYRSSVPRLLEDLEQSGRLKDISALERHAHNLRSSSANIGAMQLSELARNLENDAASGMPVALEPKVANLRGAFSRVEETLELLVRS